MHPLPTFLHPGQPGVSATTQPPPTHLHTSRCSYDKKVIVRHTPDLSTSGRDWNIGIISEGQVYSYVSAHLASRACMCYMHAYVALHAGAAGNLAGGRALA